MTGIRLQLVLAKGGVASRRAAEELMQAGRVTVNGRVVSELGTRVDPAVDRISVDGREVSREPLAYYLLNKPKGYVTTASDPEGRATVFDLLNEQGIVCRVAPPPGQVLPTGKARPQPTGGLRLFAVGRLDYNTEGALLLTNDGELAHALMHPSRGVAKIYHAKLRGEISRDQLLRLERGVELPPARVLDSDGKQVETEQRRSLPRGTQTKPVREHSAPCEVRLIKYTGRHTWLEFELHEGKNRQIHRMSEAIGSSLLKLMRVAYADLELGELQTGSARLLTPREVAALRSRVGLAPPPDADLHSASDRRPIRRYSPAFEPSERSADRPRSGARSFGDERRPARSGPPRRDFGDRPRRDFGDRPRRDFGDRPRDDARPAGRSFGDDRRPARSGPPRTSFGDRPRDDARPAGRSFGDDRRPARSGPPRGDFGDRPRGDARPDSRSFGDDRRPARSGPPRSSFGDRPRGDFGDRPRDDSRPAGRSFGDDRRPARSGPPRRDFGDRPRDDARPAPRSFGDDRRPARSGPPRGDFGDRPRADARPDSRSFGDDRRPARSGPPRRDFGDRPRDDSRPRRDSFSAGGGYSDRPAAPRGDDAARPARRPPRPGGGYGNPSDRPAPFRPRYRPDGDDARH
jgi:23S rRNA pseudouridine2605 synthase